MLRDILILLGILIPTLLIGGGILLRTWRYILSKVGDVDEVQPTPAGSRALAAPVGRFKSVLGRFKR